MSDGLVEHRPGITLDDLVKRRIAKDEGERNAAFVMNELHAEKHGWNHADAEKALAVTKPRAMTGGPS